MYEHGDEFIISSIARQTVQTFICLCCFFCHKLAVQKCSSQALVDLSEFSGCNKMSNLEQLTLNTLNEDKYLKQIGIVLTFNVFLQFDFVLAVSIFEFIKHTNSVAQQMAL